jgi:hypothetical protein
MTSDQVRAAADLAAMFSRDGGAPDITQRHDGAPGADGAVIVTIGWLHFTVDRAGHVRDIEAWKRYSSGAKVRRYRPGDIPGDSRR